MGIFDEIILKLEQDNERNNQELLRVQNEKELQQSQQKQIKQSLCPHINKALEEYAVSMKKICPARTITVSKIQKKLFGPDKIQYYDERVWLLCALNGDSLFTDRLLFVSEKGDCFEARSHDQQRQPIEKVSLTMAGSDIDNQINCRKRLSRDEALEIISSSIVGIYLSSPQRKHREIVPGSEDGRIVLVPLPKELLEMRDAIQNGEYEKAVMCFFTYSILKIHGSLQLGVGGL